MGKSEDKNVYEVSVNLVSLSHYSAVLAILTGSF